MKNPRLYVWIRSDLASMTPGKAAAQVAHAASQAAFQLASHKAYKHWENSPIDEMRKGSRFAKDNFEGFGTTIVLDGCNDDVMEELYHTKLNGVQYSGMIVDPSYPLKDGKKMLFIEMLTCIWMFADVDNSQAKKLTEGYSLYNGNQE